MDSDNKESHHERIASELLVTKDMTIGIIFLSLKNNIYNN